MQVKRDTFLASDGAPISYIDMGEGTPFVWIHGWGGNAENLIPFLKELSKNNFRCLSYDQRGYGDTPFTDNLGVPRSAQDAKELLEHLGINNAVVMGYSMGAAVLLSYVEQFGTVNIAKLLIGDMSPKPLNDDEWKYGLYQGWYTKDSIERDLRDMESDYKSFAYYFANQTIFKHTPDEVRDFIVSEEFIKETEERAANEGKTELLQIFLTADETQAKVNRLYWASCDYHDYRDAVKKIDKPTAFYYAVPGSIYDPRCARWMAAQVEDSHLYPFEDCTHMASAEKPREFQEAIIEFVNGAIS